MQDSKNSHNRFFTICITAVHSSNCSSPFPMVTVKGGWLVYSLLCCQCRSEGLYVRPHGLTRRLGTGGKSHHQSHPHTTTPSCPGIPSCTTSIGGALQRHVQQLPGQWKHTALGNRYRIGPSTSFLSSYIRQAIHIHIEFVCLYCIHECILHLGRKINFNQRIIAKLLKGLVKDGVSELPDTTQ